MRSLLMMEVVEVSDVDAIALHPITFLLDLDREVLLPAYLVEPVRRCLPYIVVFVLGSKRSNPRTAIDKK